MATQADRSRGRTRIRERLDGRRFGKLVVLKFGGVHATQGTSARRHWVRVWLCQCDCGSEPVTIREDRLAGGRTRSCGCLRQAAPSARLVEAECARPFRDMVSRLMVERAITWGLLKARWPGPAKRFDRLLARAEPAVPTAAEASELALCLGLVGPHRHERDRLVRLAAEAREALSARRIAEAPAGWLVQPREG